MRLIVDDSLARSGGGFNGFWLVPGDAAAPGPSSAPHGARTLSRVYTLSRSLVVVKRYSNGEVTVIWQPDLCRHTGICFRGQPLVFDPRRRPWIELQHADSATITAQVERCPSGALTWAKVEDDSE